MSQIRAEMNPTSLPCSRDALEDMLSRLDDLHSAASDNELSDATDMSRKEMVSVLREMIYLAQETIEELQKTRVQKMPVLHLVEPKQVQHKAG